MARFTFRMPQRLLRWCARSAESERPFRTMHLDADPDLPLGPGWFDSSWDLEQGLEVREGPPGDAKLLEWLDDCVARYAATEAALAPTSLPIFAPTLSPSTAPATVPTHPEFDTGGLELEDSRSPRLRRIPVARVPAVRADARLALV